MGYCIFLYSNKKVLAQCRPALCRYFIKKCRLGAERCPQTKYIYRSISWDGNETK